MNEKQQKTLLLGCGVGCGVIILVAIVLLIVSMILFPRFLESKAPAIAESIQRDYADLKTAGRVPAENVAEYDALANLSTEAKPGFWGLLVIKAALDNHLADGKVSADEKAEAAKLTEFMKANPGAGFFKIKSFVSEHPDLEAGMGRIDPSALGLTPSR
ncbi:MAG: hypothetical protein K1Y02_15665 [Candidatus Hydrogenedentes bacterium]|nr:hypothetical protein [Candidatus Hydrogenedentota bacterium]